MSTETPKPSTPSAQAFDLVTEPSALEAETLPGDVACDDCGFYSTEVLGECEKCHGDGHSVCSECKGAEGVECESCKGARRVFCADCHGTGEAPEPEHISNSNGCGDCEDMRYQVAADAEFLWRRDLGRNVTNGTAALYVKFAVSDYRAALVAQAESEAA